MSTVIVKSSETVRVIEHPIRGGWTLCLAKHEATAEHCFCWWEKEDQRAATEFAEQHYANVIAPPPPLKKPGLCQALRAFAAKRNHP